MIGQIDILCLSSTAWGGIYGSRQQIMSRFADSGNRVLYVETELSWKHLLDGWSGLRRLAATFARAFRGSVELKSNLYIYTLPPLLPKRTIIFVNNINVTISRCLIKRELRKLNMLEPIVWTFQPWNAGLKGHFAEKLFIYHCIDNFLGQLKKDSAAYRTIKKLEESLIDCSDLVFVGSAALKDSPRFQSAKVYLLNTGVDFYHYQKACNTSSAIPKDMKDIAHPLIVYMGSVNDAKIDFRLIEDILVRYPRYNMLMIGPLRKSAEKPLRKIQQYRNFYYLGPRSVACLPNYLKKADMCILPYYVNETVKYIFPMKVYEYLAAGRPVLATRWEGTEGFKGIVTLADSYEDFINKVGELMNCSYAAEQIQKGIELAKMNTWDQRLAFAAQIIEKKLQEKRYGRQ